MNRENLGEEDISTQVYILIVLLYLTAYMLISAFLEGKHLPIHRTAVAIVIGILIGIIISQTAPDVYSNIAKINQVIVFSILFPPMIFAQGYTLHKHVLLKNVKYILSFGLLGTFISFLISWGLIYEANNLNLVIDVNDIHNYRSLSDWEILLLSACLCSIDTTSSEESISQFKYPKLYSVVFGEDVLKDTVTIVLFSSILGLEETQSPDKLVIYWYTFFQLLLNFIILILGSLAAGLVSSVIACFCFRKMRFISKDNGITETGFLFLIGFMTYIYAEMLGFSGAISILIYGILLNHYNFYNLSKQSWKSSVNTFSLISNIAEGMLFLIMGIMVCQGEWQSPESDDDKMTHSYIFFSIVMAILCLARFVNIYVIGWISGYISKKKFKIQLEEMHILFLSGLVRGAVPFVLFSSVTFSSDSKYSKNEGIVLKTTIIFVIIFTSVILNSLIPYFTKHQLKKLSEKQKKLLLESKQHQQIEQTNSQTQSAKKQQSKFRSFEQKYIKPIMILDYKIRKQEILTQKLERHKEMQEQAQIQQRQKQLSEGDNSFQIQ